MNQRLSWVRRPAFLAQLLAVVCGGICAVGAQKARATPDPERALIAASFSGDVDAIRVALDGGASPVRELEFELDIKLSPLSAAMIGGSIDAARLLLERGAVFDLSDEVTDQAFLVVLLSHDVRMMTVLLDAAPLSAAQLAQTVAMGAGRCDGLGFVTVMRLMVRMVLRVAIDELEQNEIEWDWEDSPCFAMDPAAPSLISASFFVERLNRIDDADLREKTLSDALVRATGEGDVLLVQLLLNAGAIWSGDGEVYQQSLVSAAAIGNTTGVDVALRQSAKPELCDARGRLALSAACETAPLQTVLALLAAGARPDSTGVDQPLCLDSAVRRADSALVRSLIDAGASVEGPTPDVGWPLREAVYWGRTEIAEILIEAGADAQRVDSDGRSVVHLNDDYRAHRVRESHMHVEVFRLLASAGVDLGLTDRNGATPFNAAFGLEGPERGIARALVEAGARLGEDDIASVLEKGAAPLLGWLLSRGMNPDLQVGGSSLMVRSADYLRSYPGLLLHVLRSDARLPADPNEVQSMLAAAASENAADVVVELMRRGVRPTEVSKQMSPVDRALRRGARETITILGEYGVDLSAQDVEGNTLIHSLLIEDASERSRSRKGVIGYYEQRGIAAFLENGFDVDIVNKHGETIADVAARNAGTRQSLEYSVSLARIDVSPLLTAVRARDLAVVEGLVEAGAPIDEADRFGRTALSLSLALSSFDIARYLIRHGAALTMLPARPFLRSDISYGEYPEVASEIRLRLLQTQLVDMYGIADRAAASALLERHRQEIVRPLPDVQWTLSCIKHCKSGQLAGNMSVVGADSRRWEDGSTSYFEISRYSPPERAVLVGGSIGPAFVIEFTWTISGQMTIPTCGAPTDVDSACVPTMVITNLSNEHSESADDPIVGMVISQGGYSQRLMPGMSATIDRSFGPTSINIEQIQSRTSLMARLSVRRELGPPLPGVNDFTLPGRMKVYARLGELHAANSRILQDPTAPAATMRANLAAIRVLSALAVQERFGDKVSDDVKRRAVDIARLSALASNIRKSIQAIGRLGVADIDLMLEQLNASLVAAPADQQTELELLREALTRARASAAQSNSAVSALADEFRTDADEMIADYQGLVLEWAQYRLPSDTFSAYPIDEPTREALLYRISPTEVGISNAAHSGNGEGLRRKFGLPDPARTETAGKGP